MTLRKQRKYQPIWEELKLKSRVSIATAKEFHTRIIKAVCKEKDMDLGYKVILAETAQEATLSAKIEGARVTFTLRKSIGLNEL